MTDTDTDTEHLARRDADRLQERYSDPDEQVETVDLLAKLQESLDRARAERDAALAAAAAAAAGGPPDHKARAARAQATRRARAAGIGFSRGQWVTIDTPRSPRWHGLTAQITAVDADLGEIKVAGAWFAPAELTRTTAPTSSTKR